MYNNIGSNSLALLKEIKNFKGDITIKVSTKASNNYIKIINDTEGKIQILIYVTTVPIDNKANEKVIQILAKTLGISKSSIIIKRGFKSKNKIITLL